MPEPPVNTSIEHRVFYPYRKNPFGVATLFAEIHDFQTPKRQTISKSKGVRLSDCKNNLATFFNIFLFEFKTFKLERRTRFSPVNLPGIHIGLPKHLDDH